MIGINEKYKETFEYFGLINQLKKLDEEVNEFIYEINEFANNQEVPFDNLEWECADVINVLMQFVISSGGSVESVISKCTQKMVRPERRISEGFYND